VKVKKLKKKLEGIMALLDKIDDDHEVDSYRTDESEVVYFNTYDIDSKPIVRLTIEDFR